MGGESFEYRVKEDGQESRVIRTSHGVKFEEDKGAERQVAPLWSPQHVRISANESSPSRGQIVKRHGRDLQSAPIAGIQSRLERS